MTVDEFWHLKYGTVVECVLPGRAFIGKVVKREVIDDCCGFVISNNKVLDLKTGRKFLEVTVRDERGCECYYQSNRPDKIKKLIVRG